MRYLAANNTNKCSAFFKSFATSAICRRRVGAGPAAESEELLEAIWNVRDFLALSLSKSPAELAATNLLCVKTVLNGSYLVAITAADRL
jgi:hypothetical protein